MALGYQENTPDPSVYVKFEVTPPLDESAIPTHFLAWTTTPWTLPGNTALAVSKDADYSLIQVEGEQGAERLILASAMVESTIREPHSLLNTLKGSDLIGRTYKSLYDPREYGVDISRFEQRDVPGVGRVTSLEDTDDYNLRVIGADFVSLEDGTGIVHIAPAFGDEDLSAGRENGLNFVQPVDLQGMVTGMYPFAGKFVKEADDDIIADLRGRGLLYHRDVYHHTYPFCWRCDTPLLYYAKTSWYIRTTASKERLISGNREINWYPEYIKEGRFGEWLANNVDWAISRERYWGTPIPLWQCGSCGEYHCIGSVAELKEMAIPEHKALVDDLDLHRPYVDRIAIRCPKCAERMNRIPEVMDAWFDSGAMPFAQSHVTSSDAIGSLRDNGRFPADYICEAVDQTRGWFYSLHALSTLLTEQPSYRNVICLGLILDGQGQKMSKHQGNVVNPWTVLDAQGADATRWYLFTASQPGESRRFSQDLVNEVVRRFLLTLWNVYSFFTTYASVDNFHPDQIPQGWKPTSELDRWLMSELNSLVAQVDEQLEAYNPTDAGRRIQDFVDLLSNWYVRRSRRRFWKSENDDDKASAYATLYTCLSTLCKLMAPFTPFVAEEMYQNLVRSVDGDAPESVHLASFPLDSPELVDHQLMTATRLAMEISRMGRAVRSKAGLKVRQPLAEVVVWAKADLVEQVGDQILEELNVKKLTPLGRYVGEAERLYERARVVSHEQGEDSFPNNGIYKVDQYWVAPGGRGIMVAIDSTITPELAAEGLARELVHRIQNLRRAAGFEITDRILTYYQGPDSVGVVMEKFSNYIRQETLSEKLVEGEPVEGAHTEKQKLEGTEVVLGVSRA